MYTSKSNAQSWSVSATTPSVVGIAGLPGSGKTTAIEAFRRRGFKIYDDFNNAGLDETRTRVLEMIKFYRSGRSVAASESMFCISDWRAKFAAIFPLVQWISFQNSPQQCKLNCEERAKTMKRNLQFEFQLIDELSKTFEPVGDIRGVYVVQSGTPQVLPPFTQHSIVAKLIFPDVRR
jgi:hypothetical protein